jgi:hypothetical protein
MAVSRATAAARYRAGGRRSPAAPAPGQRRVRHGRRWCRWCRWWGGIHQQHHRLAGALQRVDRCSPARSTPVKCVRRPRRSQRPPIRPSTPRPGIARNASSSGNTTPAACACCRMARASGMFGSLLEAGGQSQGLFRRCRCQRQQIGQHRLATRQGAGLVDRQDADFLGAFERLGVLDQDAGSGTLVRWRP